jgi:hypothetical protein
VNDTGHDGSEDPYNWYYYNGSAISSEGNPVIVCWQEDGANPWEDRSSECSVVFDQVNETFVVFWCGDFQNGNGEKGVARMTMDWNNSNQSFANKTRNANVVYNPTTGPYDDGTGHIQVVIWNNSLWLFGMRRVGTGNTWDLDLARSKDWGNTWTRECILLTRGDSGDWDDDWLYRSSIVQDGYGNAQVIDGKMWLLYSGTNTGDTLQRKFGIATADIPIFETSIDFNSINDLPNQSTVYVANRWFNWTRINHTNLTGYNLQIANDSSFSDVFLDLNDINETNYGANYWQNDTHVEFILPDAYNIQWTGTHYYRVRGKFYGGGFLY